MLLKYLGIVLASQIGRSLGQALDENGVSLAEKTESIELMLLEPGTIDFPVNTCQFLLNDNPAKGEQTAAQWVRLAFHDAITFNKNTGLGGVDASIGFESDRAENSGEFVNASITDFSFHSSIYKSVADMIALGMAASMMSCDPAHPSLVGITAGRIDATGPGPAGVPEPLDSLANVTSTFARAGFNSTEMIQAIACGHSIGGVHRDDHSDIVGPEFAVRGDPRPVASFDSTPFVFDNTVVTEYLTATGLKGGPLVITSNLPARSDFRIFNSDGNATIQALAPAAAFRSTCMRVFTKIIDTVPSNVVRSAPIVPRQWLLRKGVLDLDSTNTVRYVGTITTRNSVSAAPVKASWFFGTVGSGNTGTQLSDNGQAVQNIANLPFGIVYGPLTNYTFNQTLNANNIISFNIATAAAPTTSIYSKTLNPNLFILPTKSFQRLIRINDEGFFEVVIRVAARTTIIGTNTVTATLYYPRKQIGTKAGKFVRKSAVMTQVATRGSFKIYEVVIQQDFALAPGSLHIGATLGTVSTSAKIKVSDLTECQTVPMTGCQ